MALLDGCGALRERGLLSEDCDLTKRADQNGTRLCVRRIWNIGPGADLPTDVLRLTPAAAQQILEGDDA